ncbi:MAG: flotillin family protein, partial [Bacteroidota bacterium]
MEQSMLLFVGIIVIVFLFAIGIAIIKMYRKASQGQALIVTGGAGGAKVSFSGLLVIPVLHRLEEMDITVKTIMISRMGKDGLICKDNLR